MALFIRGKTECPLCGQIIEREADAVGFPAFLPSSHRLFSFSDSAFHSTCFEACKEKDEVKELYERYRTILESRPLSLSPKEMEAWAKSAFRDLFSE